MQMLEPSLHMFRTYQLHRLAALTARDDIAAAAVS